LPPKKCIVHPQILKPGYGPAVPSCFKIFNFRYHYVIQINFSSFETEDFAFAEFFTLPAKICCCQAYLITK